ncbi:MAG: hypothetical protein ACFFG0_06065 [Candidatus Thorarchaeota archaeon]
MKKKFISVLFLLVILSNIVSAVKTFDDLTFEEKQSMLEVKQRVIPLKEIIPSSLSTLQINDPFASPGQPVVAEITLKNIGTEFPFNVIPLPPDAFVLLMGVDREVNFRTTDGRYIDVFGEDSTLKNKGILKFIYYTGIGLEASVVAAKDTLTGRTCTFVDVYDNLPNSAKEYVREKNNNARPQAIYAWDCLKISDETKFNERIKERCKSEAYDSSCIAEINKRDSHAITNTVLVALSSDVTKGKCEAVRGTTVTSFIAKNVVKCGIGSNGLEPGDSVTLRFFISVPSDTPVIGSSDISREIEASSSYQSSCIDSQFPKSCHTLYAGIYPMATNNLVKIIKDNIIDVFKVGGCGANKLFFGSSTDFEACVEARTSTLDVVGDPIWEAQGSFFVLAPQIDATVQFFLYFVFASGMIGGASLLRRG